MKFSYFYRKQGSIKYVIYSITILLIIVTLKNSIALSVKYINLRNQVENYLNSKNATSGVEGNDKVFKELNFEKKIFEEISKSCQVNHVIVRRIDLPKISHEADVVVCSQEVLLEGEYVSILKSLQNVNGSLYPIKIVSIRFEREESNKHIALIGYIVFQAVKLTKEDEN